jgi:hypothetical protein
MAFRPAFPGQLPGTAAGAPAPDTELKAGGKPAPATGIEADLSHTAAGQRAPEVHIPHVQISPEANGCIAGLLTKVFGGKER